MGVKGFSKTFTPEIIKLSKLKDNTAAVDASVVLYQSCLGMASIKGLTDAAGNPTIHINVIISRVLNYIKNNTGQVWVFDYHEKNYTSPDKEIELAKRRKRKNEAKKKLEELQKPSEKAMFSDTESDDDNDAKTKPTTEEKINQQEKIVFSVDGKIVNDCKFILDSFDIPWVVAPKGVEAEQICAELTLTENPDIKCDFVYSTDIDALIYGAKKLVRGVKSKGAKVLQLYTLQDILDDNEIDMDDLRKVAVVLGCDHASKTPRVGPKTVLKKLESIELTDEQTAATKVFKKPVDMGELQFNNLYKTVGDANSGIIKPIKNAEKINKLLEWLESKSFDRSRMKKLILKAGPDLKLS